MNLLLSAVILTACVLTVLGENCYVEERVELRYQEKNKESIDLHTETRTASGCQHRLDVVKLITGYGKEVFPQRVAVNRCKGGHLNDKLSCLPIMTEMKTVVVKGIGPLVIGSYYKLEIEEHTKCMSKCMLTEEQCSNNQTYDGEECYCKCNNEPDRLKCMQQEDMEWDENTCECKCTKAKALCSAGLIWKKELCRCAKKNRQ